MMPFAKPLLGLALTAALSTPLAAEVTKAEDGHFITRDEAVVEADLKQTWLAMIAPAKWWNSSHTWTGDSANLSITPQGGGCFCERVPEVDEPDRFTLEGSVEHMRVIHAFPEKALRMQGALGPLQSEPVVGVLTIVLSEVDEGTRIVFEYNVGGRMRYEVDVISKAVDGVMSQQLAGLAKLLGRVDKPEPELEEGEAEALDEASDGLSDADDAGEAAADEEAPAPRIETVDDVFGDLADEKRNVDICRAGGDARRVMAEIAPIRRDRGLMRCKRRVQILKVLRQSVRREPCRGDTRRSRAVHWLLPTEWLDNQHAIDRSFINR